MSPLGRGEKAICMSSTAAYFLLCFAFPFLMAYAAATDLLTMKISNRVTGFVVLGFVFYVIAGGMPWNEVAWHVAAGTATLVVAFAMFARGWVGGGDAKLAAGTALWIGMDHLAEYVIVASIVGGILTTAIVYARTFPLPTFTLRFPFAVHLHDAKTGIPYGIALATAALFVIPWAAGWDHLVLI